MFLYIFGSIFFFYYRVVAAALERTKLTCLLLAAPRVVCAGCVSCDSVRDTW